MKRILLKDSDEGFYNVITFKENFNSNDIEELINKIKKFKKDNIGEWNIDNISNFLKEEYSVEKIELFDYIANNVIDVCKDV